MLLGLSLLLCGTPHAQQGWAGDCNSTQPAALQLLCESTLPECTMHGWQQRCGVCLRADGVFYDNECLAICEGVQISEVKPDMDAKKCNMKRN